MKSFFHRNGSYRMYFAEFLFGLCCLVVLLSAGPVLADTYYVRTNGTGDGLSWQTASSDLAGVLDDAVPGDQIWVAQGAYRPTEVSSDRDVSFVLQNGVALYGGFADTGSPDFGDRDIVTYVTVLTGDIENNDVGKDQYGIVASADCIVGANSYQVVYAGSVNQTAILDGFTVTAGKDDRFYQESCGGGMYNYCSSPTVSNCTFTGNDAHYGGGMYNRSSNPQLTSCTFKGNRALDDAGGMFNNSSSPTVSNCTFRDNIAKYNGGAMRNWQSNPQVANCTFSGNRAEGNGGAMYDDGSSNPQLTNCTFSGNRAGYYGGVMYNDESSSPIVSGCTFSANTATYGGGMHNRNNSNPTVTNCIFWDNVGGEFNNGPSCTPELLHCVVQSADLYLGVCSFDVVLSADPELLPLGDYGGVTRTMALGTGSCAIDAGLTLEAVSKDQRGVARPHGSGFDIGTYEVDRWYAVTVSADLGGSVSVEPYGVILSGDLTLASKDFTAFDTPTFVITPEESMDLTGVWFDDSQQDFDATGASVTVGPLIADHLLEATFAVRTFTITSTAGAGGTVSPASASVTWGQDHTVTFTPYHGYAVSEVTVDGVSVGVSESFAFSNVQSAHALHVTFAPDEALLDQGGIECLDFGDGGGAFGLLSGGGASVDLPAGISGDSFVEVTSPDLGGFWLDGVQSVDVEMEVASAEPGGTFLCGVSFDVEASTVGGVGLLPVSLELVVSEDLLSTECLEAIADGEETVGLAEAFLSRVTLLKIVSGDIYDLFDVALDSGHDPVEFFSVSRDEGGFLVGVAFLIADAPAGGVPAVQAVPASGDCRFLVFDGTADDHYRDPLVAVERATGGSGGSGGCSALPLSGLALLMLPLLGLLKK